MRTWLPVRVERLRWLRGMRRLLRVLGTLPLVLARPQYVNTRQATAGRAVFPSYLPEAALSTAAQFPSF